MGAPAFQYKELFQKGGVFVYSSNYTLYGDLSHRVMQVLEQFSPKLEVYSIDEAFLQSDCEDPVALGREIRRRVLQWTGIPVSIGIGETKTLAKVANHLAKKEEIHGGVYELEGRREIDRILGRFPLGDIWGIGRRLSSRMEAMGITTPLHLKDADNEWVRKNFSVTVLKTVMELRGISVLELEEVYGPKKSITCSRSFGQTVMELEKLEEALASYMARASEKLRLQGSVVDVITVYLTTSPFIEKPYSNSATITLPEATDYTPELISYGKRALKGIFRKSYPYKKVGVIFQSLSPKNCYQRDLFAKPSPKKQALMEMLDQINGTYGENIIQFAAEGIEKPWQMRRSQTSPKYTTSWEELLTIRM